jgi:uncharacterized membrane protein
MKETTQFILAVLIGFSILILSLGYIGNQNSAQKIENIKVLYELKSNLESNKSSKEIEEMCKEIEQKIDSLENGK